MEIKTFAIIGIFLIMSVLLSGCIIPTYEDIDGSTKIGFPPSCNIDEKPNINIHDLEIEIHNLINIEREKQGLSHLEYDNLLADIARDHSKDMATYNFFSHINLDGQEPTDRAIAHGYNVHKNLGNGYYREGIAENIFQNWLYNRITYYNENDLFYDWCTQIEISISTVNGWMDSPGHRQNILTASYDKEGIGVAISDDHAVYITQDFW